MQSSDGESGSDQLLEAQAHVWNHIFSFINSMSLKCAVQLGIPDIIHHHGKPMTVGQLVNALPIHPTKTLFVHRLMRFLAHSGFFKLQKVCLNDPEEGYVLTGASQLLLTNNPLSVTPFLLFVLDPVLVDPGQHFSAWFQNDVVNPFATAHGMQLYEYAGQEPKINQLVNEAMASDSRLLSHVMIDKCKDVFKGVNSLVDVGGGTGTMAKSIAEALPYLECTVFDLPHVVADLQAHGNLKYLGGDMFEAIPPADAILLKWLLIDWKDEDCVKILKKCKEAITSNKNFGKVIIIETVLGNQSRDNESINTELFFDMAEMIHLNGKQRDEKEWAKLFLDAGFSNYTINPILGVRSLIEVYP